MNMFSLTNKLITQYYTWVHCVKDVVLLTVSAIKGRSPSESGKSRTVLFSLKAEKWREVEVQQECHKVRRWRCSKWLVKPVVVRATITGRRLNRLQQSVTTKSVAASYEGGIGQGTKRGSRKQHRVGATFGSRRLASVALGSAGGKTGRETYRQRDELAPLSPRALFLMTIMNALMNIPPLPSTHEHRT